MMLPTPTPSPSAAAAEAAASGVDPVLSLVIGAFGAALIAAIAGFVGAAINRRREHERWVRERRFDAYLALLQLGRRMPDATHEEMRERDEDYFDALDNAGGAVQFLGPKEVSRLALDFEGAANDLAVARGLKDSDEVRLEKLTALTQAELAFAKAARAELEVDW
jgi:hypothetical protein